MHIALVVHKFPPSSVGGTETYTHNLAGALSKEHEVFVFYRDDGEGERFIEEWQERNGFRVWRVGRAFDARRANPAALFFDTFYNRDVEASFRRFLAEVQPDIIHFQHLMLLSYRLLALARRAGIPALLTLHDYWFLCANSQLIWPDGQVCQGKAWGINCARCATARAGSPLMQAVRPVFAPLFQLRDVIVKRAALQAQHFVSPSHFLREQYLTAGFPAENFTVLENGIDVERIQAFPRQPAQDGRLRVTYLGSLAWQKGVHVLVEAFHELPPDQVHLRVYGNPYTFPEYATQLQALANPATTTFEGTVPNVEVGRVLAETDLLAVPSLWYENSPVVIQEAAAAGVPVMASRIGALPEKVRAGENGILVRAGDVLVWRMALQQILEEPGRLLSLKANISSPMTNLEHADRIQRLYTSLTGKEL